MLTRRDFLKLGGLAVMTGAFSHLNLPHLEAYPSAEVISHGSPKYHSLALTFDDCWHPEVLDQLNQMAGEYPGCHFTFFAIGEAIVIDETVSPGVWKRLAEGGHEFGYHTYHHYDPVVMSAKALIADFDQWMETLEQVLGFQPKVHFARPPYDDLSSSFQTLCAERGLVGTLYSIGYEGATVEDGLRAAERSQNGDIVQMHTYEDPKQGRLDVSITNKVLPYLVQQGFGLLTLTQLYDQLLQDRNNSNGCEIGMGAAPTRTCLDP